MEVTEVWEDRMRRRLIGPPFSTPVIVSGSGSKVVDINGVEYLDFSSGPGVLALGHGDPEVVEEIRKQVGILMQGPGKFLTLKTLEYADLLAEVTPVGLDRFFFANSGAEAVDGAIKLALKFALKNGKGSTGIIAFDYSFHGRTSLSLSLSAVPDRKRGLGPYAMFPGVTFAAAPYSYRCPLGLGPSECEELSLVSIRSCIERAAPGEIAILIAEPILATGGIIVPPPEYWAKVLNICREHGIIVIFDEVFTGFGRTGKMFASEHWNVIPDIMIMGKALGGGLPSGGFVTSEKIATAFDSGDHYTTFGANNVVALAAGIITLRALQRRGIVRKAAEDGEYMLRRFQEAQKRHALIGEARGRGLMVGVEIVANGETKDVDEGVTNAVVAELRKRRILVLTSGYRHATIRLIPPLTVHRSEIDSMLDSFDGALSAAEKISEGMRGR